MLESMRNAAQGIVGKAIMTVVMGLIIVSFVIWGVGDMLRGFTSSTVASVGSQQISAQDYHFAYERLLQQYQRRLRQPFTNEQARAIGLDREVLQRLLSEAAIDEEARKLGLDVSDEALRAMIVSNPNFSDKSGAFDPQKFASALRDNDMNERMFVSDLRKTALRQFIVAALTAGVAAPKAAVKAEADFQGQTRSIDYFVLPASAAGEIPSTFRGDAEVLLQRSQGAVPGARIPGDGHPFARAGDARESGRGHRRRRPGGLRQGRGKGSRVTARPRNAIFSRSSSPTKRMRTPPRPRSRPARASTTSSRSAILSRKRPTLAR